MGHITQAEFIRMYSDQHREQFNPYYFERNNQDIMDCVKKVILSCEKDQYYTLKVLEMREIYDYETIYNILRNYTESRRKKNSKTENPYDYINIKDSDIMLLEVKWFIRHNGTEKQEVENSEGKKITVDVKDPYDILTVLIALPRYVKKYYFRLNGNYYTSTFQIVDGSTYNNANNIGGSSKKVDCNTFKTLFIPVRIYRKYRDMVDFYTKSTIKNTIYSSNIFNNFIDCMYYILANYGLYGTYDFLDIHCIQVGNSPIPDENYYNFEKHNLFVSVPKYCMQDPMVQSLVTTIYDAILKDTTLDEIFNIRFWIRNLGLAYKGATNAIDKGLFVLDSVDGIYDIITQELLHLPEDQKRDIYAILRWLMREFGPLRQKDNVDVTLKRIRNAEYVAAIYANKISRSIHALSDMGKRVTIGGIVKRIRTDPMYVVSQIINMSNLVSYVDLVNDNDGITALKYTYKGISGLGEDGTSIQRTYRNVDPSHAGILDLDASSASDPGMSGLICPMAPVQGSSFTDYKEPMTWDDNYKKYQTEWKDKSKAVDPLVYYDGYDQDSYFKQYSKLRKEVIDQSLQIDKINCPIFSLIDESIDYSSAGYLLDKEKEDEDNGDTSSLFNLSILDTDLEEEEDDDQWD